MDPLIELLWSASNVKETNINRNAVSSELYDLMTNRCRLTTYIDELLRIPLLKKAFCETRLTPSELKSIASYGLAQQSSPTLLSLAVDSKALLWLFDFIAARIGAADISSNWIHEYRRAAQRLTDTPELKDIHSRTMEEIRASLFNDRD